MAKTEWPIKEGQKFKITAMVQDHQLDPAVQARLGVKLNGMTWRKAKETIEWIARQPVKAGHLGWHLDYEAECGVYLFAGEIYMVREFHPQDAEPGVKVKYCRHLVKLTPNQGDRVVADTDEEVRYEEDKETGRYWQWKLTEAQRLTGTQISELELKIDWCLVCGHKLRLAESIHAPQGPIGPDCEGREKRRERLRAEALVAS